jgi:hypothetical protein
LLDPEQRDAFGIVVSYSAKVKLYLGALSGELVAELPFILMHPKVSTLHALHAARHLAASNKQPSSQIFCPHEGGYYHKKARETRLN